MERRYRVLRFISTIYKIAGILAAALTVGMVVLAVLSAVLGPDALGVPAFWYRRMPMRTVPGSVFGALVMLLYGGGLALSLFAIGQVIDLFISLEANTRATTHLLEDLLAARRTPRPAPPAPPPGTGYTPAVGSESELPEG